MGENYYRHMIILPWEKGSWLAISHTHIKYKAAKAVSFPILHLTLSF